ncbi:TIGR03088 family PEP-CTERM/XrtA system glycosyltransferase [Chromatocurvus halotolerans]|uniref:Sugar transferase (PEP-CTERM/EpsH1 system associated) n=1 Tax=Chromatocurvus halotolerans TaxID=1132028 RepID=A0A4V6NPC8_9GAMM|nr:TIGR03088 family PEP-CTERM/XrtA system glycosyltransferase [Chromatocurvus halotolerans]TCO74320.1 sugar transferase (PEP-CTERM/EpsH1 system associated) [Chromatocurvus halotolerans]
MTNAQPLIVHIIYSLGTGGLENGLVNIINRCPPERYRHAIVCLTESGPFAGRITAPDVSIHELRKRPGHDWGMYWRLWRLLRRLRPAVVHTRNLAALETHILGLVMPGVKRVHGEHGRDVNDIDGTNRTYRRLRRGLSPLIHRFITVSQDLRGWLIGDVRIPERKVVQIYNGVDLARFDLRGQARMGPDPSIGVRSHSDLTAPSTPLVIGTVGRLATVKNQHQIIRALAHIISVRPRLRSQLRCIVVGDGPERAALEAEAFSRGVAEQIEFTGDRGDIPDQLARMDVFLLPSLNEGISNTVLEAMASGLPVIATDIGGNPELVQPGVSGTLVPVGDAEALGEAILELLDHPARRQQYGAAAKDRIQREFDWSTTVRAYLGVYDAVLGRRTAEQGAAPHKE